MKNTLGPTITNKRSVYACVLAVYIHNPVSFVVKLTKNGRRPKRSLASVSTYVHV